jgi:hypothetical protein
MLGTLKYAKRLHEAGLPLNQAEVHADALREATLDTVATKQDLRELETRVDGRFRLLYWMLGFNLTLSLFTLSLTAGLLIKLLAQ